MLARVKSLFGQTATYGLGNLLSQGIRFFLIPVYTRFLTTADYGVLSVATTFGSVVTIFLQLGLPGALTRLHYDYLDSPREQRTYYGTIWLFMAGGALLLTLLLFWQGDWLFRTLFPGVPFEPYGSLALWTSFLGIASVIPLVLFRVREQAPRYVAATFASFLLTTLATIYFVAVRKEGAEGSLTAHLLVTALFAVPYTAIALRNARLAIQWNKLKQTLVLALPLVPHQLSSWALSLSDRIVLTQFVSLSQLGIYTLGYRFGQLLDMALASVNMAWSPFFFRTASTDADAPSVFARITTYYSVFLFTAALAVALLSRDVIRLMAQPDYHEAHTIVPVVAIAFVLHGFYFMLVNQLFFVKETKKLPLFTGVSAAANIGLNFILVPRFGIMAAAWNTVIGYLVLTVLVYRESTRLYPIPYEYRRIATLFVAAIAVWVPGNLAQPAQPLAGLAVRSLFVALYPALLFAIRFFSKRELVVMRQSLVRLWERVGS